MKRGTVRILFLVLTLNVLDLSTTLMPHEFDGWWTDLNRPVWLWYVQGPIALLWVIQCWRIRKSVLEWWTSLSVPRTPKWFFTLFVMTVLGHAMLRVEHYPFSPVIMFSVPKSEDQPTKRTRRMMVIDSGEGWQPISLLLEGNPFLSQYLHTDYKAGWTMRMYASSNESKANWIAQKLYLAGAPLVGWAEVTYARATGKVEHIRELARFSQARSKP